MSDLIKHSIQNWQNLIELYENISSSNPAFTHTEQPFKSIFSKQYAWPNFTILESASDDVGRLSRSLNESICKNEVSPVILVHPSMSDNDDLTQAFDEYGIRQIAQWPLIYYDLKQGFPEYKIPQDFLVVLVDDPTKLQDWGKVASPVLFNNKELPLESLIEGQHALYVGYENDIPVASVSAFFGKATASAHMGAVLPEHRKKGYGKLITKASLEIAIEKGYDYSYSQSSQMGLKSWLALGYKISGYINLFWKVGHN